MTDANGPASATRFLVWKIAVLGQAPVADASAVVSSQLAKLEVAEPVTQLRDDLAHPQEKEIAVLEDAPERRHEEDEPAEGFEPPARALRKRCSTS